MTRIDRFIRHLLDFTSFTATQNSSFLLPRTSNAITLKNK